ncbi:hypothetical protein CDAR_112931 [Caerostris darwini]|uniref:Uncharacterized protein n=1 Tax=Caerostris darwini TaxID=1538125 RepID=A0AAV4PZN7_9ARAC|nr:hypothetical protein CDAR_112931 [Caerostris darwini]
MCCSEDRFNLFADNLYLFTSRFVNEGLCGVPRNGGTIIPFHASGRVKAFERSNRLSFRKPHHHSRQRNNHQPFVPNLGAPQPWETHGHRRRYRKRGHHHHHGVQLLRSVSTPTPNRNRQHQPRQFNDLWVKLDTQDKSSSDVISDSMLRNSRKKLHSWKVSRNDSHRLQINSLIWTICLAIVWSRIYLQRFEVVRI